MPPMLYTFALSSSQSPQNSRADHIFTKGIILLSNMHGIIFKSMYVYK